MNTKKTTAKANTLRDRVSKFGATLRPLAAEVAIDSAAIATGVATGVVSALVQSTLRVPAAIVEGVSAGVATRASIKDISASDGVVGGAITAVLAFSILSIGGGVKELHSYGERISDAIKAQSK